MEGTILRSEVYRLINSGEPFDMVFVTCNRKKGTGGELITVESWLKIQKKDADSASEPQAAAGDTPSDHDAAPSKSSKNPNHSEHGTVNIFNPANAEVKPIKVHFDLIQFLNGKRVID